MAFQEKGLAARVAAFDEGVDLFPDLLGGGEADASRGGAVEDQEPDFDRVHPEGMGRGEMEACVG
ncbi:MAG TPA: hypothetical protein VMA37_17215 [Acetobacteraceae bacterium]|nr:hypothetical protein [Acetobacteraceae bacterium]